MKPIRQFDIYWIDLEPARGVETKKHRPCVILSSDIFNQGRILIVAPLLKSKHSDLPWAVHVAVSKINGLDQQRIVDIRQLRSLDKKECLGKYQGVLEDCYHPQVWEKVKMLFGKPSEGF